MRVAMQPVVRKQHNTGYKHKVCSHNRRMRCWGTLMLSSKICLQAHGCTDRRVHAAVVDTLGAVQANVRNYYMQFEETQTQDEIDSKIKEFEERSRGAFAAQVSCPALLPFHNMYVWCP